MPIFLNKFSLFLVVLSLFSCTDIELEDSNIESENLALNNGADTQLIITTLYNTLATNIGDQSDTYALNEVTTDEIIIPTRGADWNDNGVWRDLHDHTWGLNHPFITDPWSQWTGFQCEAATILADGQNPTDEERGQGHFLRAIASFYLLDNFGQLPICDPSSDVPSPVLSAVDAVEYIIQDLEMAIDFLPSQGPGISNDRASKGAAYYLLAKITLNAHIYRGDNPTAEDMDLVISLINFLEADGYSLEAGFFDIFRDDVDNETVLYLNTAVGNRIWNTLHFNQAPEIAGGGWNGFATLSEFYDLFEGPSDTNWPNNGQEERRGFTATQGVPFEGLPGTSESGNFPGFTAGSNVGFGFLFGQQYEIDCSALEDRLGNPLIFERFFVDESGTSSLFDNSESTGIRILKNNPQFDGGFTFHLLYFRFADAHLMRAEAMFRGGDIGNALIEVNELRELRGAETLGALTEQDILDERGRELYIETWRRNDLIRFGKFNDEWELKDPSAIGNTNLNVFPIPSQALIDNPNLQQNPGY